MANGQAHHHQHLIDKDRPRPSYFQMPLHYPRYTKADYEKMPEWKLECLFAEYGLSVSGDLSYKRDYAIGAFTWE